MGAEEGGKELLFIRKKDWNVISFIHPVKLCPKKKKKNQIK